MKLVLLVQVRQIYCVTHYTRLGPGEEYANNEYITTV